MSSPIADLSYRNYDGPLLPPVNRWWAIAKMSMRQSVKKRGFWWIAALVSLPYGIQMITFYVIDTFMTANLNLGQKNPILQQVIWKDRFLDGFSYGQLFYLILALMIGAGTIANDNRANALLVYLSKPCSKLDYVVGKWLGIFLLMTAVTAVPTMFFFGYCMMGYRDYGFLTEDPRLFLKVLAMCLVPGAIHASLTLGISSLFNQGRLAGAAYAGLYFIPLFVTKAMQVIIDTHRGDPGSIPSMVNRLFYGSIDGIQIGLAKTILSTDGSVLLSRPNSRMGGGMMPVPPPAPPTVYIVMLALIPCVVALMVAWSRVRAVEVVG